MLGFLVALATVSPAASQQLNTAVRWNDQALEGSGDFQVFKFETFSGPCPPPVAPCAAGCVLTLHVRTAKPWF